MRGTTIAAIIVLSVMVIVYGLILIPIFKSIDNQDEVDEYLAEYGFEVLELKEIYSFLSSFCSFKNIC